MCLFDLNRHFQFLKFEKGALSFSFTATLSSALPTISTFAIACLCRAISVIVVPLSCRSVVSIATLPSSSRHHHGHQRRERDPSVPLLDLEQGREGEISLVANLEQQREGALSFVLKAPSLLCSRSGTTWYNNGDGTVQQRQVVVRIDMVDSADGNVGLRWERNKMREEGKRENLLMVREAQESFITIS